MIRKYNKGEWSELYVIYSVLIDGKIIISDENLISTNDYIKVSKVFIDDSGENIEFIIDKKARVFSRGLTIELDDENKKGLLREIIENKGRSFSCNYGDNIIKELMLNSFKSDSYDKTDLDIVGIMPNENIERLLGFSVKSKLGSLPTLINASKATNFIYKVDGLDEDDINSINLISTRSKVLDRVKAIKDKGGVISYYGMSNEKFRSNLRMIDSKMPELMAYMLLSHFSHNGASTMSKTIKHLEGEGKIDFSIYEIEKKVKDLLMNVCLGMIPTKPWKGDIVNGGCVIVKSEGQIVCFTLNDINKFREYLFNNTKFDTASTSRHEFGELYKDDKGVFIKLNLDVRML